MNKLAKKIALVTGASKGIGAGIAKSLAYAGATVVVNYSSSKKDAEAVVAEIVEHGAKASAIQGDFSKEEDIKRVYKYIKDTFGTLDILVNNAGVYQFGPIEEVNPAEFHRHYDLNVLGLLLSIKESLPLFPESGGSIINIGSTAGKMAVPKMSVYSGTKGAVDSITISLSKELGHRKIRVNSLNPGVTETEGTVSQGIVGGEFAAGVVATTPLGRVGQPDDIGGLAALIASDDAYWLTGQLVYAAGGLTM